MWWKVHLFTFVLYGTVWIFHVSNSEKDFNTCSFYYWKMDWHSAVKTCEQDNKQLLCYRSKKEIEDITEAFRLSAFGNAELELWLSNKNCSETNKLEECLSLHISKSSDRVWHFFQEDCEERFPFVCCVKESDRTTTTVQAYTTTAIESTTSSYDKSSTMSLPPVTTSVRPNYCKKVWRRGIQWPDTLVGETAIQPCPGNSTGEARWSCENTSFREWSNFGPDLKDCRSLEIINLKEKFNTSSISYTLFLLEEVFSDHDKEIFGADLADVISLMTSLPDRFYMVTKSQSGSVRWTTTKDMIEKSVSIFDRMIELNTSWQDMAEKRRSSIGTDLLSTIDGMGLLLADSMIESIAEQSVIGKNMALQVIKPKYSEPVQLPQWAVTSQYGHRGNILLEKGYDVHLTPDQGGISVVFTLYTDLSNVLSPQQTLNKSNQSGTLNSAVVSATVSQKRIPASISNKVKIYVEHLIPQPNHTACVFWNMQRNGWDTHGCMLVESNDTYSVCACDHLTNFAVLMDYQGVLDKVDQLPFFYITVIGCTLSIICLAICVIVFTCYSHHSRHAWGLRYVIHRNLCLTLLIANLVLVLGLDKTEDPKLCAVIAGLLHYFFLSAFSWMLLEGVHIYLLLVVVFASRRSHWEKYYLFGYGFPLIIVTITAISRPMYYGSDEACWLSAKKGTIWAFMGPVAGILLANTAALILAQWKASNISIKDDNIALFKRWLRVTFILFPVLGITWIFGFLYVGKHLEVAGYLFAIFNSLQGFCIFVCHCAMDKKARNMVIATFRKKSASVNTGSSGTQKRHKGIKDSSSEKVHSSSENEVQIKPNAMTKSIPLSFQETCRKNWNNWHKPWSFCFDMPVTERGSQEAQKERNGEPPKPIIVQWNNLNDKGAS